MTRKKKSKKTQLLKDREEFRKHCEGASRIVDSWLEWKKSLLNNYFNTESNVEDSTQDKKSVKKIKPKKIKIKKNIQQSINNILSNLEAHPTLLKPLKMANLFYSVPLNLLFRYTSSNQYCIFITGKKLLEEYNKSLPKTKALSSIAHAAICLPISDFNSRRIGFGEMAVKKENLYFLKFKYKKDAINYIATLMEYTECDFKEMPVLYEVDIIHMGKNVTPMEYINTNQ